VFADKICLHCDPKCQMTVVWSHCKGKMVCKADDVLKEDGEGPVVTFVFGIITAVCNRT
jgi:succinyl-CoA synthetase alpha subunit